VEAIIRYVDRSERHIWTSLPGYINHEWDDLCDDLRLQYVDPSHKAQFTKKRLVEFADNYARKCMADETDVINYHHKFNNQAKPLVDSLRITEHECNGTFWRGFHPDDQLLLRERLIAKHPNQPRGQVFDVSDVLEMARAVFSGDDDFVLQEPPHRQRSDRTRE
jgi:hypothetical protein